MWFQPLAFGLGSSAVALATLRLCADSLHFPIGARVCSVVPTAREVLVVCAQQRAISLVTRISLCRVLFSTRLQLLDALGGRQVLGHGAPEFLDGLADFGANFAVGAVGVGFADDAIASQFLLRLRRTEQVGSQLGAAQVIQDLFAGLQPLSSVDVLRRQPTIQALITVVLEDGIVARLNYARAARRIGKLDVVRPHLFAQPQSSVLLDCFVVQLLPPLLERKVCLPQRDTRLAWIGILDRQIARIARKQRRPDRAQCTLADLDHFGDINEMILDGLPAVQARQLGLVQHRLKVPQVAVAKRLSKLPTGPASDAQRVHVTNGDKDRRIPVDGRHEGFYASPMGGKQE